MFNICYTINSIDILFTQWLFILIKIKNQDNRFIEYYIIIYLLLNFIQLYLFNNIHKANIILLFSNNIFYKETFLSHKVLYYILPSI